MPILNLTCVICEEDFRNSDTIQSTYCGHIFHKHCLDDWKLRRRSCPMCQREFGTATFDHQLFLVLDNPEVNLEELRTELLSSNEKNEQLQVQIAEIEFNFLRLQEEFTAAEQSKKEMEKQIREQICIQDNFLELQRQFTESTETTKDLKKLVQQMTVENEKKSEELDLKCVEISYLKTYQSESGDISSDSVLKNQVKILEQKIKYVSAQLEKEIAHNTCLSIEKMKIESCVQAKSNRPESLNHHPVKKCENIPKQKHYSSSNDTDNCLIIENFPIKHITCSLKNLIINLGAKMHLPIRPEDISEARILDRSEYHEKLDEMVSFFVKFEANDMKINFLANKNLLKDDPVTSSCIVRQHVEKNSNSLFVYAKEKLKNKGFVTIYCANYRVFAKTHEKSKPLQILNKGHVDNLLKRYARETTLKASDDKKFKNHDIDENFYQL